MVIGLSGKSAVVTGAASGLGLATARLLASRGARVALVDVDAEGAARAAAAIGGDAFAIDADIADAAGISAALDTAAERLGGIDVVVANAGITASGSVLNIDAATWERVIEVNLLGTWRTVRAALPHLLGSKGYLLLVSSGFAAAPGPHASAYAASKAAIESLGRSARIEVAHHGVDVGIGYFGFLDTPLVGAIEADPAATRARDAMPAMRRTHPVGAAAAAIVRGIERRADRVVYPGALRGQLLLRGMLGRWSERSWRRAMPEVERLELRARESG